MSARDNWRNHLRAFPRPKVACAAGYLQDDLADEFRAAIEQAPVIPFTNEPRMAGVEIAAINPKELAALNREHVYRDLDDGTKAVLRKIFAHLKEPIAALLGTPWRILNARSWTTRRGASMGPNIWHTDGDVPEILKLMLYGTPTGGEYGGLEYQIAEETHQLNGQSWFLFHNSLITHRGIAPRVEGLERVATEVTLCQSEKFCLEPIFLGLAARHALEPDHEISCDAP
jgi:hypothetical protein